MGQSFVFKFSEGALKNIFRTQFGTRHERALCRQMHGKYGIAKLNPNQNSSLEFYFLFSSHSGLYDRASTYSCCEIDNLVLAKHLPT